jgi:hypothetical protein
VQTFLPYPDFEKTAKCLDYRRLGKQRVEAWQLLNAIENRKNRISAGWTNHPATLMWLHNAESLKLYFNMISLEWERRGYKHNMGYFDVTEPIFPKWVGNMEFHMSHQSNLVRKLPEHYRKFFPDIPNNLPYVWPKG